MPLPRLHPCLVCLLLPALAAAASPPALPDQHGTLAGLADGAGAAQVVMVVSAKRLRRLKPWERALRERFGDLHVLRVADVPRTAPTSYERVAATLRRRLPPDVNVQIDLDGVWAERFDLDTRVPNVLVFDAAGRLRARQAGMFARPLLDALTADAGPALAPAPAAASAAQPPGSGHR